MTNPDRLLHVFRTFMGIVPDSGDAPLCGAELTSAYNGHNAPHCPTCDRLLRHARLTALRTQEFRS